MDKVLGWLFRGYSRRIKERADTALGLQMEAYKATFDVKDLIRERLKGVRPNHPDDGTLLQNHIASLDDAKRLVFLSKAKDVVDNEAFQMVVKSLIVQSEHDGMLNADNMVQVNFNRATINGAMVIEEDLLKLDAMFKEESELSKKMTEEERLSAL